MAFMLYKTDDGRVPPTEYLPDDGNARKVGEALVNGDTGLETATGNYKPLYISVSEQPSGTAGRPVPVIRVGPDLIFETVNQASFEGIVIGDKVTIHTDGMQVTATTSSGDDPVVPSTAAEVVGFDGTAVGSRVFVRF